MAKKRLKSAAISLEWDMTPMIDVVFLLMIFFIFTFKIVKQEGDFSVQMQSTGTSTQSLSLDEPAEPLRVSLFSNGNGDLTNITIGDRSLGTSFAGLRQQVLAYVGSTPIKERTNLAAELYCDYNLKYQYTVDAMTHISGYIDKGKIVPLIENISFVQ